DLSGRLDELPRDRPIATICRGGKRSGLAASILQRAGFEVVHVGKGIPAWRAAGHPVESGSAPAASAA
ncbi:MAG TPA: rhodanese-like domain-containing protein, partial [Solirubrobacterales bacterium]|nr:rhodanese-like domain-containing protein [Solirubrobacterales bacterium]